MTIVRTARRCARSWSAFTRRVSPIALGRRCEPCVLDRSVGRLVPNADSCATAIWARSWQRRHVRQAPLRRANRSLPAPVTTAAAPLPPGLTSLSGCVASLLGIVTAAVTVTVTATDTATVAVTAVAVTVDRDSHSDSGSDRGGSDRGGSNGDSEATARSYRVLCSAPPRSQGQLTPSRTHPRPSPVADADALDSSIVQDSADIVTAESA